MWVMERFDAAAENLGVFRPESFGFYGGKHRKIEEKKQIYFQKRRSRLVSVNLSVYGCVKWFVMDLAASCKGRDTWAAAEGVCM